MAEVSTIEVQETNSQYNKNDSAEGNPNDLINPTDDSDVVNNHNHISTNDKRNEIEGIKNNVCENKIDVKKNKGNMEESDVQMETNISSIKSDKLQDGEDSKSLTTGDDEKKPKRKRRSKLSLNSDVKTKGNKFKDEGSQATLISFFNKMSPKTDLVEKQEIINLEKVQTIDLPEVADFRLKENGEPERRKKKANSLSPTSRNEKKKNKSKHSHKTTTSTNNGNKEGEAKSKNKKNSKVIQEQKKEKPEKDSGSNGIKDGGKPKSKKSNEVIEKQLEETWEKDKLQKESGGNANKEDDGKSTSKKSKKVIEKQEEQALKKEKLLIEGTSQSNEVIEQTPKKEKLQKGSGNNGNKEDEGNLKSKKVIAEKQREETPKKEKLEKESRSDSEEENDEKDLKKVRFSNAVEEFSPEPVRKKSDAFEDETLENKESETTPKGTKKECTITTESTSCEVTSIDNNLNLKIKNAFKFMMDSRHKSIGQNSPGKELENKDEPIEMHKENKTKLTARKALLQDWADTRGAKKRKIEDEEKGIVIEHKLEKRAKRLRKMLMQEEEVLNDDVTEIKIKKRKAAQIMESDSDGSDEADSKVSSQKLDTKETSKKQLTKAAMQEEKDALNAEIKHKKLKLVVSSDNSNSSGCSLKPDENSNGANLKIISSGPLQQTELSSFFGVLTKNEQSDIKTKHKSKLQLKQKQNYKSIEENTKEEDKKKKKTKSKLALKKDVEVENSKTCTKDEQTETTLPEKEIKISMQIEKQSDLQMILTPKSLKQWKMRLRVKLADADDGTIEKIEEPCANSKISDCEINLGEVCQMKKNEITDKLLQPHVNNTIKQCEDDFGKQSKMKKEIGTVINSNLDMDANSKSVKSEDDSGKPAKMKNKAKKVLINSDSDTEPLVKPHTNSKTNKCEDDLRKSAKTKKKLQKIVINSDSDTEQLVKPHINSKSVECEDDSGKSGKMKKKAKEVVINSDSDTEPLVKPRANKTKQCEDNSGKMKKNVKKVVIKSDSDTDDEPLASKKYCKKKSEFDKEEKVVKLAPMFIRTKPNPKPPKVDKATIVARRKFLHSGIPDSLKKAVEKPRVDEIEYEIFPSVSHVALKPTSEQLTNSSINFWNLPAVDLNLKTCEVYTPNISLLDLGSITTSTSSDDIEVKLQALQKMTNVRKHIKQIKDDNPSYPVYKAFKFLHRKFSDKPKIIKMEESVVQPKVKTKKSKKGAKKKKARISDDDVEIEDISHKEQSVDVSKYEIWSDKYRPSASDEIFGNHASVSQLKSWLETWLQFSEEINMQRNRRQRRNSNSSSEFENSDADSRDCSKLPGNTMILCGPHGSGKTMTVYALCNELGINILELNASSKRTGKRLLQELQEATQSHQVRKNDTNSLTALLKKDELSSQSSDSQSSTTNKKMCLLFIEDVDIVFEQDENFITALNQLLMTSKRPLVLTTTDKNCLHLKKFFTQYPVMSFSALSSRILTTWLQVLCLIEGLHVNSQTIAEMIERNNGDVRRTLLQLQFWVQTGGEAEVSEGNAECILLNDDYEEILSKDDSSNLSWLNEEENVSECNKSIVHSNCLQSFGYFKNFNKFIGSALDLGDVWWNLSNLLIGVPSPLLYVDTAESKIVKNEQNDDVQNESVILSSANEGESSNLQNISNIFETLAMSDVWYDKLNVDCDLEPVHKNKCRILKNSLELNESIESCYSSKVFSYELSHTVLNGYVNLYNTNGTVDKQTCSSVEGKYLRTKLNRCEEALLEAVPVLCHLDRRSVSMDYLATLRTMARTEVVRASNNNKRGNRFYNYLRGIGIGCNDSVFQTACSTFRLKG